MPCTAVASEFFKHSNYFLYFFNALIITEFGVFKSFFHFQQRRIRFLSHYFRRIYF